MVSTSEQRPAVLFTAHSHQVLSNCIHLLGVSILSYCLSHRLPPLTSFRPWLNLTWGRLVVILVLFDSWLFIFFTGVLVNGVGLSYSHKTCALAIYACISFYALSKILIYGFLVEKVYIVWSGGNHTPRFSTPAYRICALVMIGYITVIILMIVGQMSLLRADGICIIGLKKIATISMITYDLFLNVFLTAMFLWPLWRSKVMSHRLRNIATRTLYGALVSLTTSAVNIIVLLSLRGEEFGWVCLGSCVTDVALNAIALSWVTAGSYSQGTVTLDRFSLPTLDVGPLTLAQRQFEWEQDPYSRGTITLRTTLHEDELNLPESFYDYIPRDQLHGSQPNSPPLAQKQETDEKMSKTPWRPSTDQTIQMTEEVERGAQSLTLSEDNVIPSARNRAIQFSRDTNAEVVEKDSFRRA